MKNEELIRKWLTDQLTEAEEKLLKDTDEYAQLETIWASLSVATPPDYSIEEELERFHSSHNKQAKVVKVSWHQRWIGIAASVILISIIGFLLLRPSMDTESAMLSEGLKAYYLPDSSIVTLNKGSELAYETEKWATSRKVMLDGEGFFQVKKGSTFEVVTSNGTVSVLGTSFNVKQRGDYYEVICYEGKVGVETSKQSLKLIAGGGYREASLGEEKFNLNVDDKPGYLIGQSSFFRTPYYSVLEELENQYDIVVETNDIDLNKTFTGSFPNDDLDVALDAVTIPSGYLYQQKDDKVLITGGKE
ncbi:FecR domain-containing protein [Roseivirga sp. UBA1976]|uniref:FecR family protein n=1 Tax=Roseivirga sp. UBA1976 TaxID=1947386 RepID=UPI00257E8EE9|nr:FecR domain-containing protein [Roseivirga sp. UBA1976]|tara:strand:+ start:542 stop:1453 length:912 start_codon:yes stop_codon:yes gene_type:complete